MSTSPVAFEPTPAAALARLEAVDPAAYARTRNHLEGAVTGLGPYVTHGFLGLPQVRDHLVARHRLRADHKLIFELAWREYFRHVWAQEGDGILASLHAGPLPDAAYASELPADLRQARTGVPAVDAAVRQLYATGTLHNHARMWLASYTVHLRKVHWRAGADWMLAHLLDGDLASNHLSWQWVAGTGSAKPYLFNAGNVARYAPRDWHSSGTAVDRSYEALDAIARGEPDLGPEPAAVRGEVSGVMPPAVFAEPPAEALAGLRTLDEAGWVAQAVAACAAAGDARVRIVHPWSLGGARGREPAVRMGLLHAPYHSRFPWSARRWAFVLDAMHGRIEALHAGDARRALDALVDAGLVPVVRDALVPGWREAIEAVRRRAVVVEPVPREWADPDRYCASFTRFWNTVAR